METQKTVGVIVPLLNEIKALPTLLAALCRLGADELVLVDGGSSDGSYEWLLENRPTAVKVIQSVTGRASQMNAGAQESESDVLVFLHADTVLPNNALKEVHRGRWGRFDVGFHDNVAPKSYALQVVAFMMNWRSRMSGVATGDQAIFVERTLFSDVGRYKAIPIMEDVALSKELRKKAPPFCSRVKVRTSARRWRKNGVWRTIFLMWSLRLAYVLGVSPDRLYRVYNNVR